MANRLRVVVRADLSPGQQAVQGMHSQTEFSVEFPDAYRDWHSTSNTIAFLAVPDEDALEELFVEAASKGMRASYFREPDRDNEMTAICLEPSEIARKLCKGLAPALRDP